MCKQTQQQVEAACGRLLMQFPLFSYRSGEQGNWTLCVLVAGCGQQLRLLLGQILSNGQLLDTRVEVTVVTPDAGGALSELEECVPGLRRFLRIRAAGADSEPEWDLGTLRFLEGAWSAETMAALMRGPENYRYVVVCTDDDACSRDMAAGCGVTSDRLVAYTCGDGLRVCSPRSEIMSWTEDPGEAEWMKRIGYNLHYVYQKFTKPRASRKDIEEEYAKSYNYTATRQNVLHIRSKLACCGMEEAKLNADTAAEFAALLKKQPGIVDRLADLEHRRWVLEKTFLKGYCLQEELHQIYQNDADSTHSEADGWHVCLVPSSPGSRLTFEDWQTDNCREDLDELNRVTLQVHRICRDIADEREEDLYEDLEKLERQIGKTDLPAQDLSAAREYVRGMAAAVSQMYQKKRIAYARFCKNKDKLENLLKDIKKNKTDVSHQISSISRRLAPLAEYNVDKEHKDQDYLFVEKIPFALTHKKHAVLLKLLGEKGDDQFAPWQMEPTDVIYAGFADTAEELDGICAQARRIHRFLGYSCNELKAHYHLFVLAGTPGIDDAAVQIHDDVTAQIHTVASRNPAEVFEAMNAVLQEQTVDYVDVTGGCPVMVSVAERFAEKRQIGLFYVQDGQMRNICRAEELEYPAPRKGISVREMFEQSGAVLIGSEGSRITNLSKVYETFWKISRRVPDWDKFCKFISNAYSAQTAVHTYSLRKIKATALLSEQKVEMDARILADILPVIRALESKGYMLDVKINRKVGSRRQITFRVPGKQAAERLAAVLKQLDAENQRQCCYELNWAQREIVCRALKIENAALPKTVREDYAQIFRALQDASIISHLKISEADENGDQTFSFDLSAVEFLSALRNSGKALEYYLYNTALQKGRFDDADMSWLFFHNSDEESAKNELDVICTKGTTSLFISAKDVSLNTIDSKNFLNYVCYEVSLLADRFGINSRTVLAAPKVPQFDGQEPSRLVRKAWKRGVYLLGDACFIDGNLGKVLDNIAQGKEDWYAFLLKKD